MTYEINWHRTSREKPAPGAICYLAVLADPDDTQFTVTSGYYDRDADEYVDWDSGVSISKGQVYLWAADVAPQVEEVDG